MQDFLAFYKDFEGTLKTNGELNKLKWYTLEEAKNKKIADVTEFMINEIIKLKNNYNSLSSMQAYPMFTWKKIRGTLSGTK